MATEILMPQMGESIAEGTITKWLVQVGDRVERDDPLLEISTDKVDAEIPAPASGVLIEIRQGEGVTVPVNEIVGLIGEEGESTGEATEGGAEASAAPVAAAVAPAAEAPTQAEAGDDETSTQERVRRFSSPLVRRIAKEEGVDLAQVQGTGIHGRVTKKDITAYLEARSRGEAPAAPAPAVAAPAKAATPTAAPAPSAPATPAARLVGGFSVPAYGQGENVRIEPMSRIRERTAAHMTYSKATSAHVSTVFHFDMSRIAALRQKAKAKFQQDVGTKLTFMPFIFKAVCDGLRQYPQLNAAIDGTNIVYKNDINLGMAVALDPSGLIVPVLHKADGRTLMGLARTANDLADRARTKKLKPEEAAGGTFTVTNPGGFGSLFGTPIINQPQVAILGIGAIEKRPVIKTDADGNDMIAIRTMCYFALTFDHRLVDGADADHFMNVVKKTLEEGEWSELDPFL